MSGRRTPKPYWFALAAYWRMMLVTPGDKGEGWENAATRQPVELELRQDLDQEDIVELDAIFSTNPHAQYYLAYAQQDDRLITWLFDIAIDWHIPKNFIAQKVYKAKRLDSIGIARHTAANDRQLERYELKQRARRARRRAAREAQ